MRIRADQIQVGDRLQGKTVKLAEPAGVDGPYETYVEFADFTCATLPDWLEVEIVRPEPPITVTIELTPVLADWLRRQDIEAYELSDLVIDEIIAAAVRALREQENPE